MPRREPRRSAARTLAARRAHDKGDGNFPSPDPERARAEERPIDRRPRDTPKDRDPRSAPKPTGDPESQKERNPGLQMRDEYKAPTPRPRL